MTTNDMLPDQGLVEPISLPPNSKVPEPKAEGASAGEYDRYFQILRGEEGLLPWTRTCLEVTQHMLPDLQSCRLSAEDQLDLVRGCLLVLHVTLSRWAEAAASLADHDDGTVNDG